MTPMQIAISNILRRPPAPVGDTRVCEVCGMHFVPATKAARFCGIVCREAHKANMVIVKRARMVEYRVEKKQTKAEAEAEYAAIVAARLAKRKAR